MDYFVLIRLVGSHLTSDFLLQTTKGVDQRRRRGWRSSWLYLHGAIAGLLAYIFSGRWSAWWLIPTIAITHVLVDGVKAKTKEGWFAFVVDQAAHLAVIILCWAFLLPDPSLLICTLSKAQDARLWIVALGYITVIWPAGIVVGAVTGRFRHDEKKVADATAGVDGAGLLIGKLERFLILTFILLNHFEAIGFLIAAKSIFRFQEMKAEAEYIIIGSMMSFSVAVVVGLLARRLLAIP
jgi:hypothetical protein